MEIEKGKKKSLYEQIEIEHNKNSLLIVFK